VADALTQWVTVSSQFVAAGLMLALAVGILVVNGRSRVTRAFAAVLVIDATIIVMLRMVTLTTAGGSLAEPAFAANVSTALMFVRVAYVPAVVLFLLAYIRPAAGGWFRWLRWGTLAAAALVEAVLLLHVAAGDRCIVDCTTAAGKVYGPLSILGEQHGAGPAIAGLTGLAFAIAAVRRPVGALHTAVFLLSLGFTLNALVDAGPRILDAGHGTQGLGGGVSAFWGWTGLALDGLGLAAAVASLAIYAVDARNHAELRRRAIVAYVLAAGALATAAYVASAPAASDNTLTSPNYASLWASALVGLARLALPAMAALALVKHRLFGIEVRVNHGLSRSLVVGAFLVVFFIVTQIVQNAFSNATFGVVGGGIAAGILLFALHPLQNLGHRLADAVVPAPHRVGKRLPRQQAAQLYRDQAMLVWADGYMGRKERALLDQLRDRLGVPLEDAARIEREAADAAPARRFPQRKSQRSGARPNPD